MSSSSFFRLQWLALVVLAFSLTKCSTAPSTEPGPVTDTTAQPEPGLPTPGADVGNMFFTDRADFFNTYRHPEPLPFNAEFIKARFIQRIEVSQQKAFEFDGEIEMEPSQRISFEFNREGEVVVFQTVSLLEGQGLDSTRLEYIFDEEGEVSEVQVQSFQGDHVIRRVENELGFGWENPKGESFFIRKDDSRGWRYITHYFPDGSGFVHVMGPEGAFPDTLAEELHHEILERRVDFVRYDLAPNFRQVELFEEDAEQNPVREIEFEGKGDIFGVHTYTYDDQLNPLKKKFEEDVRNGKIVDQDWNYDGQGRLVEITIRENEPGASDNFKARHTYEYAPDGSLMTIEHAQSRGLGAPDLDRVESFTYEKFPEVR